MRRQGQTSGFTLVELMVVMAIGAVLLSLSVKRRCGGLCFRTLIVTLRCFF
jgi:prepilin-type N-terminal cleavage/methylation domain-containing protein